jgi:ABC-2 type transport system permease protein
MLNALLYLRVMSVQNWLRSRLRRLRQPKYLVGAIVGCAYF